MEPGQPPLRTEFPGDLSMGMQLGRSPLGFSRGRGQPPVHTEFPADLSMPPAQPSRSPARSSRERAAPTARSAPELGQDVVLVLTRLIDMPIEKSLFGATKKFRVRVFDAELEEVAYTTDISGLSAEEASDSDASFETISIPRENGILRFRLDSLAMFLEVEHVGALFGGSLTNSLIGRCQIHRLDPRSAQVWPYALSDDSGQAANCGIELKVVEEGGSPLPDAAFTADTDAWATHAESDDRGHLPPHAAFPGGALGPLAGVAAPAVEALQRASGRTGNFPPGSPEEALEQATINAEAQNRALLQHCKKANPLRPEGNDRVKVVNGYREWDSLDALFTTMGPNPMALSEEVGPTVARSYQESSSVMKELARDLLPESDPAQQPASNLELVKAMYHKDPERVTTALRPVICKDPAEIARSRDMSWCPEVPIYAPLRNMREEDKETLRLACYGAETDAALNFADANPNYRVEEDVWGLLADDQVMHHALGPAPCDVGRKRVKDDCIMA